MLKDEIKLSIVIVNFRSERYLSSCLTSLVEKIASRVNREIIIVNNDKDEELAHLEQAFSQVIILPNKNSGFGEGCNRGAREAKGKYILFLNPDTEILSSNVDFLLEMLENDEEIGIIGGCLKTEKGEIQEWGAGFEINMWELIRNNFGVPSGKKIWKSENPIEVCWVAGTAMLISRKLFFETGGFDEEFFMYFEDVDLCRRVRKSGKKIMYVPYFKVLHKCGESYSSKVQQKRNYYDSQQLYFEKHCGKAQALLLRLLRKILV